MGRGCIHTVVVLAICLCSLPLSAAEPIRIAAVFPITGDAVQSPVRIVVPELVGARQGMETLNQQGGLLGRRVQLMEYDSKSTPLGSATAARHAVRDGCIAVIGSSWSSLSLGMAPVLQAARIPMITPISTNPDVTLVGDYIFRACFIDPFQGSVMADFSRKDLHARTAVVMTNASESYCMGLARFFISHFTRSGGKILWECDYLAVATDFTPFLKRVKELNPDVVFVPGMTRDSGYIIKQARMMGIKTLFLGGDGWDNEVYRYGGKAIEGSYYCNHWHPRSTRKKSIEYVKAFQKPGLPEMNPSTALAFDAVMLLADAVKRAQSFEPARIRDALLATKAFDGVTGDITFDKNRNPIRKSAVIMKFENGSSVYVKTVTP